MYWSLESNLPTPTTTPKTNLDSDKDGIPNSRDNCDYEKENFNNYQDTDGCPDAKPIRSKKNHLQNKIK